MQQSHRRVYKPLPDQLHNIPFYEVLAAGDAYELHELSCKEVTDVLSQNTGIG